jgi:predicted XRE-type DNA-binding protein
MIDDPIPALKEHLGRRIVADLSRKNHFAAARMLGLDESRMSNLKYGHFERFSLQMLVRLLARINRRVDLTVVVVGPLPNRGDELFWEACERVKQQSQKMRGRGM